MYIKENEGYVIIPADLKQTFANKFTLNIGRNEIIKMKNSNVITDRDVEISEFLFKFKFATVDQIYRYLKEDKIKTNIKNRLDKLVKYRVLNKFMLSELEDDKIAEDAFEIYCLDLGGKYLLENYSKEDTSDWYSTVNMKTSEIISKNIFVAEFFLRLRETCPAKLAYFKIDPEFRVGKKNVFPSFEMCLDINGQKKYFIGEVAREYEVPVYFRDKMYKLESLITTNAWKKYYYDAQTAPILFVFGDSDETALEIGKMIADGTELTNYRISTDNRIKKELFEVGAFLKYLPEQGLLQEIKAVTFKP